MASSQASNFILLHNPRCSKSRGAKALLEERGVVFEERLYLESPLSEDELARLRQQLGRPAVEWARRGEAAFKEAGLDAASEDAAVLSAMAQHPILIERPIAVKGDRALVGRPPENILELLDE